MTTRPNGLTSWQTHVLSRLDELSTQIGDLRADVGSLKGRARAWGAIPGVVIGSIACAIAYFK